MRLALEQVIDGKYRVVRVIGEGGMGTVYEGENVRIGRKVAIKVLNAEAGHAPDIRRRFEREAQVSARIGSPHVCDVLDLGDLPDGQCYLVMEYLEGEGLDVVLERGPLGPEDVTLIAYQLLDGLRAMHEVGIIHRDLKPANVYLAKTPGAPREIVKILDFGVSKFQNAPVDQHMTQTGAVLGTPLYMSPEQARGKKDIDGRSDIYSVGVILFRALAGRLPFEGDNYPQLLFKIALEAPPPLAQLMPELDRDIVELVETAMAKDPDRRFQTARDFQDAIIAWGRLHGQSSVAFQAVASPAGVALSSGAIAVDNRRSTQRMPPIKTPVSQREGTPSTWEQVAQPPPGTSSSPHVSLVGHVSVSSGPIPAVPGSLHQSVAGTPSQPSIGVRAASQPSWPSSVALGQPSPLASSGHRVSIPAATDSGVGMPLDRTIGAKTGANASGARPSMGDSGSRSYAIPRHSVGPYIAAGVAAIVVLVGIGGAFGYRAYTRARDEALPPVIATAPPPRNDAPPDTATVTQPTATASATTALTTALTQASATPDPPKPKPTATVTVTVARVQPTATQSAAPPPPSAEPTSTAPAPSGSGKPGRKIRTDI